MNKKTIQTVALILILFLCWLLYYGSWLPLKKARGFIQARQTQITSLENFNLVYDGLLSQPSPTGQEEITSNYLGIIAEIIVLEKNKEQPNAQLIELLVAKAEEWGRPIIEHGTGFSFSQIIFSFGSVYQQAFMATRDARYYQEAIELYEFGLEQSPDRQVFLYSLFDIHRFAGNREAAIPVGERIVEVYKDEGVAQILQAL